AVTVANNPAPIILSSGYLCEGKSITLSASKGFDTYLWSPNGETKSDIIITSGGTYGVTVTDQNGCTGQASIDVEEIVLDINADVTPYECGVGGSITITMGGNGSGMY
ncbi:MAG TPA: hypothetical protein PKD56_09555, partial [Chitinophagales bacterium]|nr:hypothetical protein [Chitinophagales bacterium]